MADTLGCIGKIVLEKLFNKNLKPDQINSDPAYIGMAASRGTQYLVPAIIGNVQNVQSIQDNSEELVLRLFDRNKYKTDNPLVLIDIQDNLQNVEQDRTEYLKRYEFDTDFVDNPQNIVDLVTGNVRVADTPMVDIGYNQYKLHMGYNFINNFEQETNSVNVSLKNGVTLNRIKSPTKGVGLFGGIENLTKSIIGAQIPGSSLPDGAINWREFRTVNDGFSTEATTRTLLNNTNKFHVDELKFLLGQNTFTPQYFNGVKSNYYVGSALSTQIDNTQGTDGDAFNLKFSSDNFNDSVISDSDKSKDLGNRLIDIHSIDDDGTKNYGRLREDVTNPNEVLWNPNNNDNPFNKKSLLHTTFEIVKKSGGYISDVDDRFPGTGLNQRDMARGSAIKDKSGDFARTFTKVNGYNKVKRLIRHRGLDIESGSDDTNRKSVLDDNGFVRIGPYTQKSETSDKRNPSDVKRFMLSLENLAWMDDYSKLPLCEKGPNGGRIMWFPPYDLSVSDNADATWNSVDFIGRSEPIYTYNNSKRAGNLIFKVIVDHSHVFNHRKDGEDDDLEGVLQRFIHGVDGSEDELEALFSAQELNELEVARYLNSKGIVNSDGSYSGVIEEVIQYETNITNFDDVSTGRPTDDALSALLNKGSKVEIRIVGSASKKGSKDLNKRLSLERATSAKTSLLELDVNNKISKIVIDTIYEDKPISDKPNETETVSLRCPEPENDCNFDRQTIITFTYVSEEAPNTTDATTQATTQDTRTDPTLNNDLISRIYENECNIFQKLEQDDSFVLKELKDKIKFFHPAFHSTSPIGFNKRLTFLHQCLKQGPSIGRDGIDNIQNLAFGRPPVCILRIGDFYHTKVVINSLSVTYTDNSWDLNPEGIGVQPMIAEINLGFNMIGGSSLDGPINRLQNAVSFNFFANTELYDVRSAKVSKNVSNGNDKDNQNGTQTDSSTVSDGIDAIGDVQQNEYKEFEGGLDDSNQEALNNILPFNT